MGRQANISDMFACRLLIYTPMGWIPADSIDSTTNGYSHSPNARVFPPSPWYVTPLGGGTPTGPLESPPSPPSSRCCTRAPTEPPPYKLCDLSVNFFLEPVGDTCLDVGALLFTYESAVILEKILWVINEFVWVIVVYIHKDWVHCRWWEVMVNIWMIFF